MLRPGDPDPSPDDEESGSSTLAFMGQHKPSPAEEAVSQRLVGRTRYFVFNVLYALAIWVLVPISGMSVARCSTTLFYCIASRA